MREQEDVELEPSQIANNPGRRAVAKLMLNSFWGKFGQSDEHSQTTFIYEPKKFYEKIRSHSEKISDTHLLTDKCVMVTSTVESEYNEGNPCGNLAIAAFTTSLARLKLLDMMRQLGDRVLYTDTDSVMYISRPGDYEPPRGNLLGQWTDELKPGESHIVKFMSLGPKSYSYVTDTGRQELKSKSFTQNGYTENVLAWDEGHQNLVRTGNALNFDCMNDLLQHPGKTFQVVYPSFMKRDFKEQSIKNVVLAKQMRLVYDKRILHDDFSTRPYGTRAL